ncbi:MAG: aerotolerance regulator BatC, partial [Bacteroidales bacterium]|nr:aerotolerance regulator BatC [Bacteroidales bacterium]
QQQNKDKQKKQPQPQSGDKKQEQKKKDAERILDAVKNNEKKTLDKQKVKVRGGKIEKDW